MLYLPLSARTTHHECRFGYLRNSILCWQVFECHVLGGVLTQGVYAVVMRCVAARDVMACTSRTSRIKCNSTDVTARRTQTTTCCLAPADLALALQEADLKGG